jgi:choline dehydrogenase-like flavoprotein
MQSENSPPDPLIHDVIIAGAGPVGLFLAGELALAKCSVLILEKAENPHSPLKQFLSGYGDSRRPRSKRFTVAGYLKSLRYTNALGTPTKLQLPKDHVVRRTLRRHSIS